MNNSVLSGCLYSVLRFCGGAIMGAIGTMFLWQISRPAGGPNYGDGVGYGFAMMSWMFAGGLFCGISAVFMNRKKRD